MDDVRFVLIIFFAVVAGGIIVGASEEKAMQGCQIDHSEQTCLNALRP